MALSPQKDPNNLKVMACPANALSLGNVALERLPGKIGVSEAEILQLTLAAVSNDLSTSILGLNKNLAQNYKFGKLIKRISSLTEFVQRFDEVMIGVGSTIFGSILTRSEHILAIMIIVVADQRGLAMQIPDELVMHFEDAVTQFPDFAPSYQNLLDRNKKKQESVPDAPQDLDDKPLFRLIDTLWCQSADIPERLRAVRSLATDCLRSIYTICEEQKLQPREQINLWGALPGEILQEIVRYDPDAAGADESLRTFEGVIGNFREKVKKTLKEFEASAQGQSQGDSQLTAEQRMSAGQLSGSDKILHTLWFNVARQIQTHFDIVMVLLKGLIDLTGDERLKKAYDDCVNPSAVKQTRNALEEACFLDPRPRELFVLVEQALRGLDHPAKASLLTLQDILQRRVSLRLRSLKLFRHTFVALMKTTFFLASSLRWRPISNSTRTRRRTRSEVRPSGP